MAHFSSFTFHYYFIHHSKFIFFFFSYSPGSLCLLYLVSLLVSFTVVSSLSNLAPVIVETFMTAFSNPNNKKNVIFPMINNCIWKKIVYVWIQRVESSCLSDNWEKRWLVKGRIAVNDQDKFFFACQLLLHDICSPFIFLLFLTLLNFESLVPISFQFLEDEDGI